MYQGIMFYSIPCYVRAQGEVPNADESNSGVRSSGTRMLLREASTGKFWRGLPLSVAAYSMNRLLA